MRDTTAIPGTSSSTLRLDHPDSSSTSSDMCYSHRSSDAGASNTTLGPPGAISLEEPTHWYCHACGWGPMIRAIYAQCIRCSHWGCSSCTGVTIYANQESNNASSGPSGAAQRQRGPAPYTTPADGPAEWFWWCCCCNSGPASVALHGACIQCNHYRCERCKHESP